MYRLRLVRESSQKSVWLTHSQSVNLLPLPHPAILPSVIILLRSHIRAAPMRLSQAAHVLSNFDTFGILGLE